MAGQSTKEVEKVALLVGKDSVSSSDESDANKQHMTTLKTVPKRQVKSER